MEEMNRLPLIGDKAPEFSALTTNGRVNFPEDYKGKWVLFFSHPSDFTPVCTTEFMTLASMQEEFEAMTQEVNDYIINVGQDRSNINPFDSAHTEGEAIQKAEQYCEDWKCVEVVYMPCDNEDVNEIIWSFYDLV